jgi:hypothetical protein
MRAESRTNRDATLRAARGSVAEVITALVVEPGGIYLAIHSRQCTSATVARGPFRRPDVVARPMETDRTALGQVALDF